VSQDKKRKIYPPTQLLLMIIFQVILGFLAPLKKIVTAPSNYSGIIFIVFGIAINLWADAIFKKQNTAVKPDEKPSRLIESGPFRISRHPMYLGMIVILLGIAILMGSLSAFIFPIIFFLIMQFKYIPQEEKIMENEFGKAYLDYKKKARKWI
jgi:protein-S-isoprenylcysteine O-methyltransferase Ste14